MSKLPSEPIRTSVDSGTTWEALAGYARAVRVGAHIFVSGTTATDAQGNLVGPGDAGAQTRYCLDKIERAIVQLGGRLEHVVRTRIYVSKIADWEAAARVHGERFAHIRPANTLVQAALVGTGYLVEIEADAIVVSASPEQP